MGLFSKRSVTPKAVARTVARLDPEYYTAVYAAGQTWGSPDSREDVVTSIDNAVFNVGTQVLDNPYDQPKLRDFVGRFGSRTAALPQGDAMVDFLIGVDPSFNETISLLTARLLKLASQPPQ